MSVENDEFFVGYLPTPSAQWRWLRVVALACLMLFATLAAIVAATQRDPGKGKWDLDHPRSFEGILDVKPYPLLRGAKESLLIVEEGKHGAADRLRKAAGIQVRVRGHLIERSSMKMIELADADNAIEALGAANGPSSELIIGAVTLRGEIIDPKCFLGAMKPGEGKTHKACAALCIRGGVPPMFLASDGSGFLLADKNGDGFIDVELDRLIPFVADSVELVGILRQRGDGLRILCVDPFQIRRL